MANVLCEKVMASCNLSERDAEQELRGQVDNLVQTGDVVSFCQDLGLDDDDVFSNMDALYAYL